LFGNYSAFLGTLCELLDLQDLMDFKKYERELSKPVKKVIVANDKRVDAK
jgi:hypothetical protein